jgi:hypothetical protein
LVLRLLDVPEDVFGDLLENALSLGLLKVVLVSLGQVFHKAVLFVLQEVMEVLFEFSLKVGVLKNLSVLRVKSKSKSSFFRIIFSIKLNRFFVIFSILFEKFLKCFLVSLLNFRVLYDVLSSTIFKDVRILPRVKDLLQESSSFVSIESSSCKDFFRSISVVFIERLHVLIVLEVFFFAICEKLSRLVRVISNVDVFI